MKRVWIGLGIAIALLTVGSVILPAVVSIADAGWFGLINLTPTITTVSPSHVKFGSPAFTLTVNGTNFVSDSVVHWNGANRTTTYISPIRLTAVISATDVITTGAASVTVFNPAPGGGTSNPMTVTINSKTNTTTTITSDLPDPSQVGPSVAVIVAYTVTASAGTPTGLVTVTDSAGSAPCSGTVAAGSCTITFTTTGARTLTATYGGDANFNDSSGSAAHVVFGPMYLPFVDKAPSPTPTSTPTPTPTPPPIANPIRNGGFESANTQDGPWYSAWCSPPDTGNGCTLNGSDARSNLSGSGASPHTGSYAAWLGGNYNVQWETAQYVTVPAGGSTLRYWHRILSDEPVCDINNIDGAWLFFISDQAHLVDSFSLCTGNQTTGTNGWAKRDIDLSPYVGQTGWIKFIMRNLGAISSWFIDDVAMGTLSGAQFVPYKR